MARIYTETTSHSDNDKTYYSKITYKQISSSKRIVVSFDCECAWESSEQCITNGGVGLQSFTPDYSKCPVALKLES